MMTIQTNTNPVCPACSGRSVKSGKRILSGRKLQQYKCTVCGYTFRELEKGEVAMIGGKQGEIIKYINQSEL